MQGVAFRNATLDDVIAVVRAATGLEGILTPFVSVRPPIGITTPTMGDVSVEELLTAILEPLDLQWRVRGGGVWISLTMDAAVPDHGQEHHYFDVHDLVAIAPDGSSPAGDALVERIRAEVDPDAWRAEGARLSMGSGVLVARARAATLDRVRAMLETERALAPQPPPTAAQVARRRYAWVAEVEAGRNL